MTRIGKNGGRFINPCLLLRIMATMKSKPLKVWIGKELGINMHKQRSTLVLLKKLGLVEEVEYFYDKKNRNGTYCRIKSRTTGWKLKNALS